MESTSYHARTSSSAIQKYGSFCVAESNSKMETWTTDVIHANELAQWVSMGSETLSVGPMPIDYAVCQRQRANSLQKKWNIFLVVFRVYISARAAVCLHQKSVCKNVKKCAPNNTICETQSTRTSERDRQRTCEIILRDVDHIDRLISKWSIFHYVVRSHFNAPVCFQLWFFKVYVCVCVYRVHWYGAD